MFCTFRTFGRQPPERKGFRPQTPVSAVLHSLSFWSSLRSSACWPHCFCRPSTALAKPVAKPCARIISATSLKASSNLLEQKGYYPGYRQLLKVVVDQSSGTTQPAVINWQVALMPYLEKLEIYEAIQSGAIGQAPASASGTAKPLPYWELSVCPSDNSISGHSNPWTSYVANTGLLDSPAAGSTTAGSAAYNISIGTPSWTPAPAPPETSANGVFQDQVLGTMVPVSSSTQYPLQVYAKVLPNDFKDGQTATLLLTENIDAHYYSAYDDWSSSPQNTIPLLKSANATDQSTWQSMLTANATWGDCWERGAGFIWWDTS